MKLILAVGEPPINPGGKENNTYELEYALQLGCDIGKIFVYMHPTPASARNRARIRRAFYSTRIGTRMKTSILNSKSIDM